MNETLHVPARPHIEKKQIWWHLWLKRTHFMRINDGFRPSFVFDHTKICHRSGSWMQWNTPHFHLWSAWREPNKASSPDSTLHSPISRRYSKMGCRPRPMGAVGRYRERASRNIAPTRKLVRLASHDIGHFLSTLPRADSIGGASNMFKH